MPLPDPGAPVDPGPPVVGHAFIQRADVTNGITYLCECGVVFGATLPTVANPVAMAASQARGQHRTHKAKLVAK